MIYFDNEYLQQYLNLKKNVIVTVDNVILTLADEDDVSDPNKGVGYTENGESHMFDYMDIEKIQVGQNIIDLDTLQKIRSDEPQKTKEPEPKKPSKPEEEDTPPEEEPSAPDDEKNPSKGVEKASYDIYLLGRELINESRKRL